MFSTTAAIALLLSPYLAHSAELIPAEKNGIPGQYVVMLKEPMLRNHATTDEQGSTVVTPEIERAESLMLDDFLRDLQAKAEETPQFRTSGEVLAVYELNERYSTPGMLGFGAHLDATMLEYVLDNDMVDFVEEDQKMFPTQNHGCTRQRNAQWGLPRTHGSTGTNYDFHNNAGRGVDVYVLDTGIRRTHNEFEGRATWGRDTMTNNPPRNDPQGHGTHVASSVGGRLFGVAKQANIIDVRVLGTDGGTTQTVINGLNWVAQQCRARGRTCIANMSLGGGFSSASNRAVDAATGSRVLVVTASGNDNQDGCRSSPGSASTALNVNAADRNNRRAGFSNWGRCTNIWAPGASILGASHLSNTRSVTQSGTSMAAPHVAGVAAKMLALNPSMTVAQLRAQVLGTAQAGFMTGQLNNSPNQYVRMTC